MTKEEEIANLRKRLAELESEDSGRIGTLKSSDGMFNPADFISKANEKGYTVTDQRDPRYGQTVSYNRGDKWCNYIDKRVTDPSMKRELMNGISKIMQENPDASERVLKYKLRALENALSSKYNTKFDISGSMTDRQMGKMLRGMNDSRGSKPEQRPDTAPQKPVESSQPRGATGKRVGNSNIEVSRAKPGDWIVRSNGETVVLTQAQIDWAYKKVHPNPVQTPQQAAEQQKAMDAVRAQQTTPGTAQQRSTAAQQAAGASQAKQAAQVSSTSKSSSSAVATDNSGKGKKSIISQDKINAAKNYTAPEG